MSTRKNVSITALIQIPHVPYKKVLQISGRIAKFQAPKTPRTGTIFPEHLLAHMFTHITAFGPFVTIFQVRNNVLITSTRAYLDRIFRPRKHATRCSCRIVNVRYRNDLLVTEIHVVNSAGRVRFSSENYGILKDCWMKLLDSCV